MVRTSDLQVNSLALYLLSYEGRREFLNNEEVGQLIIEKELVYSFNGCIRDADKIANELMCSLSNENKVEALSKLIEDIREKYRPRIRKRKYNGNIKEHFKNNII